MTTPNGATPSDEDGSEAVGYTSPPSNLLLLDLRRRIPRPTTEHGRTNEGGSSSSYTGSSDTLYVLIGLALWVGSVATAVGIILLALRVVA